MKRIVSISFYGNKGNREVYAASLIFDDETQQLVIDWDNKTVEVFGKKDIGPTIYAEDYEKER